MCAHTDGEGLGGMGFVVVVVVVVGNKNATPLSTTCTHRGDDFVIGTFLKVVARGARATDRIVPTTHITY